MKRRTEVVGAILPNPAALLRLARAVLVELQDESAVASQVLPLRSQHETHQQSTANLKQVAQPAAYGKINITKGYATEGDRAVLEHGFATVGLNEVWAETMAVNAPSRRVMTRLGLSHLRTEHRLWDEPLPGADQGEVVYGITRENWLIKTAPSSTASC